MAQIKQFADLPNILIVGSRDIYYTQGDYREKVRDLLYAQDEHSSPVRKGTHDFWITYPIPALPGHSPNHSWEDTGIGPRPQRGIVEMAAVPPTDYTSIHDELSTLLQEVGHHWLVPSDMEIPWRDGLATPFSSRALTSRLNSNTRPFDRPVLLGRGNIHWSAYFQSDQSPFDGQHYDRSRDTYGADVFTWRAITHATVDITRDSVGAIQMRAGYNDLDLMLMGVLHPEEAYARTDPPGRFTWIEPQLTSPLNYQVGVFVAFGRNDLYTFGFYQSHDTIAVERSNGSDHRQLNLDFTLTIPPVPSRALVLRVVRRGQTYYFQARYDGDYADPAHDRVRHLAEELNYLPDPDPNAGWEHFRTVGKFDIAGEPQAIGLIVRKWDHPYLAEGVFFNLELQDARGDHVWRFSEVPSPMADDAAYTSLVRDQAFLHRPGHMALARTAGQRLYLGAPYSSVAALGATPDGFIHHPNFETDSNRDRAPKIVVRPAAGDFSFGTSASVARTILTPWAGGSATGTTQVGQLRSARARDVRIPDSLRPKQDPPPDNTYRMAFILVAEDPDKVDRAFVQQLDVLRRYWDVAFAAATRGRRQSDSRLARLG